MDTVILVAESIVVLGAIVLGVRTGGVGIGPQAMPTAAATQMDAVPVACPRQCTDGAHSVTTRDAGTGHCRADRE